MKSKLFRAYWFDRLGKVRIWSLRARSLDEAVRTVTGVVPVRPVEVESEDAVERMVVK